MCSTHNSVGTFIFCKMDQIFIKEDLKWVK